VIHQRGDDRIAIISDVHGNLTALEAVLEHIQASGITRIFNLGDLVGKGPRPAAVVDLCQTVCEVTVQGNWDAEIPAARDPTWLPGIWHRRQLGPERLAYLADLPGSFDFLISGKSVRLFHASAAGIFNRVYETDSRDQHRAMFANTEFTGSASEPDIVGYGDIHTPYVLSFEGRTLFNVGSVGNPLDAPLACYCILEGSYGSAEPTPWSLNVVRVPYDIEAEVAAATISAMPDLPHYVGELRTAIYRGRTVVEA